MLEELIEAGLAHLRATPVAMGGDMESMPETPDSRGTPDGASVNRRTAVYLGTMSRLRPYELELMIDTAKTVGQVVPDFELLVIGDSETESEKGWLARYARAQGADCWVRFTGWRPYSEGLTLASSCTLGLSPFPRGPLSESASPTKVIEYLTLGLPVVCNDQPDQARVVRESGGGLCVGLTVDAFAAAIRQLLEEPEQARAMGEAGRGCAGQNRDYRSIATNVAGTLRTLGPHWQVMARRNERCG